MILLHVAAVVAATTASPPLVFNVPSPPTGGPQWLPSEQKEVQPVPQSCVAAKSAMRDQEAMFNILYRPGEGPGQLGRRYIDLSDRLSAAMKADSPDMQKIAAMWRDLDKLKIEINQRFLVAQTECTLDRLRMMPAAERQSRLRLIAPVTRAERARIPTVAPAPPPPPRLQQPKL